MIDLKRTFTVILAAGACVTAGACGGDDEGAPIPPEAAASFQAQLDNVQARLDNGSAGACRDILEGPRGPNRAAVEEQLAELPQQVDPDVRSALEDSFNRLWELVEQECEDIEAAQPEPEPEPVPEPEPTPTETTETETTPTETVPPEENDEELPDEEELPPEGDGDNDGLIPNGGGVGPGAAKGKSKGRK